MYKYIVDKKVNLDIAELEGENAFFIIGVFCRQAKKGGWSEEEIDLVKEEATSQNYGYMIDIIGRYCESLE